MPLHLVPPSDPLPSHGSHPSPDSLLPHGTHGTLPALGPVLAMVTSAGKAVPVARAATDVRSATAARSALLRDLRATAERVEDALDRLEAWKGHRPPLFETLSDIRVDAARRYHELSCWFTTLVGMVLQAERLGLRWREAVAALPVHGPRLCRALDRALR
jgi:hypothetical protein